MALNEYGPGPGARAGSDPAAGHDPDPAGDDELLPCGASLALLWEDGTDPAHAGCAHCASALDGLAALDRTVQAALTVRGDVPDLAGRVMDLVRTELRPGPLVPLAEPEGWITETAAARLLRRAAEGLPGVTAGSCRITALSGRTVARGRLPREPLRVRLEIAVDLSRTVRAAGAAVRARVLRAADRHLGLDLAEVDITVIDLLEGTPPERMRGRTVP